MGALLALLVAGCAPRTEAPPIVAVVATLTPTAPLPTAAPPTDAPPTEVPPTAAPTPTDPPSPTDTPALLDLPDAVPTEPPTAELSLTAEDVFLYPVPQLYSGDRVTFQVYANVPPQLDPREVGVRILVDGQQYVGQTLGGWRNLAGEAVGLYQWAWSPDVAGSYTIDILLDPDDRIAEWDADPADNNVALSVTVLDRATLGTREAQATWETIETTYATVHLVTGTAADRDRAQLLTLVDEAVLTASNALGVAPIDGNKVEIFFIDRVIGQGGYAASSMVISYPDRNYAGGGLFEVLVHESIHVLDNSFESDDRFVFLIEGLAVWGTGGHYKAEDLQRRAAALYLDTGRYIPLAELIDNFYPAQHEVGYLQGGAFVDYLVQRFGWERVRTFYGQTYYLPGVPLSAALSVSMEQFFGVSLAQLEADWLLSLTSVPRTAADVLDLELTIEFYEVMREYQRVYDPTAYFLHAWLPYPNVLREQNLTADLTRHPNAPVNIALEAMLEAADNALRAGDYDTTRALLGSVRRTVAAGEFIDPLAANYLRLVQHATDLGLEAQDITIIGSGNALKAEMVATDPLTNALIALTFTLEDVSWILSQ